MIKEAERIEQNPGVLYLIPPVELTSDQFFKFCQINRDWRIEQTAEGVIEIMPPAGGETSSRNLRLGRYLDEWAEQDGTGVAFDSSGGFILPNGATRSPDAAWALRSRLTPLKTEIKQKFLPICPDFVIELRSPSDSLKSIQDKMEEYIANGAQLGWLIDPTTRRVHIYRTGSKVELLQKPTHLDGEAVLPGFVLNLKRIWEAGF